MRKLIAIVAAIPIVGGIFLLMVALISSPAEAVDPPPPFSLDVLSRHEVPPDPIEEQPDEPPEDPSDHSGPPTIVLEPVVGPSGGPPVRPGPPADPGPVLGVPGPGGFRPATCDGGAVAIATPVKGYPVREARDGSEGWVLASFTVLPDGSTTDVVVVDAAGGRGFEQHARESVRRWRFRPAQVDCEAVASRLQQRIDYRLDDG